MHNEIVFKGLYEAIDFNKIVASLKDGKVTAEEVKECIDSDRIAKLIVDELLEPTLNKIVASTENKWDDTAKAMFFPIVAPELRKLITGLEEKI